MESLILIPRSTMKYLLPLPFPVSRRLSHLAKTWVTPLVMLAGVSLPVRAIDFSVVYESTVDAAAQAVIAEALTEYSTRFSDEVTVSLKFKNSGTGLGSSSTYRFNRPFGEYYSALIADASTVNDQVALASLNPSLPANQVYGPEFIQTTRVGFAAVGIDVTTNHIPDYFDGRIDLNLSLTNYDRLAIDPLKYDLRAVVWHEVNEILGTSSGVGGVPTVGDIFRYRSDGARTFTTEGDDAYFSIDGITPLARFNQQAGLDYGDFWSGPNHLPQVQDASGTSGATPNMGVEIVMLDVVGWNAVPEPSALAMISLTMSVSLWRRRRGVSVSEE